MTSGSMSVADALREVGLTKARVYEKLLCSRLTTDTGSTIEFWELNTGDFELLTAEGREVVGAVTLTLVEAELLAEKLAQATGAQRREALAGDAE